MVLEKQTLGQGELCTFKPTLESYKYKSNAAPGSSPAKRDPTKVYEDLYLKRKQGPEMLVNQEDRELEMHKSDYTFKPNLAESHKRANRYAKGEGGSPEDRTERLTALATPRVINKPKEKPLPPV